MLFMFLGFPVNGFDSLTNMPPTQHTVLVPLGWYPHKVITAGCTGIDATKDGEDSRTLQSLLNLTIGLILSIIVTMFLIYFLLSCSKKFWIHLLIFVYSGNGAENVSKLANNYNNQ